MSSANDNLRRRYEAVVIGAGQAGLATGYYLKRLGIDFVILDAAERVGDSWRNRWESLRLFTPAQYNSLPGLPYTGRPFAGAPWTYPTKDDMAEYLEVYAARFELPVHMRVRVDRLTHGESGRFVVSADGHSIDASNVVVASGAWHEPLVPEFAADLDSSILQMHSSEYRRPSQLRDGPVLVVGAANSGAESRLRWRAITPRS